MAFRELVRKKQALTKEECIAILKQEKRGVLSLLGDDDYPYGTPHNHWYNDEDGCLYFHSGMAGHKVDAFRRHDKASFCVYVQGYIDETSHPAWALHIKSVIVFGRIEVVENHDKAIDLSRKLSEHFTEDKEYIEWDIEHSGARVLVFRLRPEHITGKLVNEA